MTSIPHDLAPADLNRDLLRGAAWRQRLGLGLLSLPGLILVGLVLLVPLGWLFWLSGFDAAGDLTFANYARLLRPAYVRGFVTTFEIAGIVTAACIILGYPVAYLLVQVPPRVAQVLLLFIILPFWTSVLVRTYAWLVLLQREGVINSWLLGAGLISQPLELVHNMLGTVIGMVHVMLPFLILPLYASMKTIDPALLLAAANCGASPTRAFRQVFLPLSMPGLAAGVGLTFVLCLGFYLTPALLGGGKVAMWSMQIADNIALYGNWGAASALGVVLLVVTAIVLFGLRRVFRVPGAGGGE